MVVDLDKTTLRPVQKESYLCMARCCDSADSPVQLQQCVQRCEQSIQARHAVIQATMGDFQNRLQRCVGRCQDAAQESLPASPGDKDIRKAQEMLESCAGNCAAEYERQIPKLKKTIVDSLKNVQS
ncbi:hypothetical protein QBZ16_002911 [Prototheca wickerhamii]|uniref:Protein FAM136A n=1 Tax=Prototheca wickerhamii TaxID=3111 RepID=A0AAD9IMA3_PROWI|nr:hypothetical protein QBZ16_002911 [Prototheca wickerhamii]